MSIHRFCCRLRILAVCVATAVITANVTSTATTAVAHPTSRPGSHCVGDRGQAAGAAATVVLVWVVVRVDASEQRAGDEDGEQAHEHQDGEGALRQHVEVKP
jgi:hypothetical protein